MPRSTRCAPTRARSAAAPSAARSKRYYDRFDALAAPGRRRPRDASGDRARPSKDAEKRTGARAARKLTTIGGGRPPGLRRASADDDPRRRGDRGAPLDEFVAAVPASANIDIRVLLQKYSLSDIARRVVGVGSVGTRCYLIALAGRRRQRADAAGARRPGSSVLIEYGGVEQPPKASRATSTSTARAAASSRCSAILQAVSDPVPRPSAPAAGGRPRSRLLRPPVPRHEGRLRHGHARGHGVPLVRRCVRRDAGAGARPVAARRPSSSATSAADAWPARRSSSGRTRTPSCHAPTGSCSARHRDVEADS